MGLKQAHIRLEFLVFVGGVYSHGRVVPRPDSESTVGGNSVLLLSIRDFNSSELLVLVRVHSIEPLEVIYI